MYPLLAPGNLIFDVNGSAAKPGTEKTPNLGSPKVLLFVNLNSQRFFDGFNELLFDDDENNI